MNTAIVATLIFYKLLLLGVGFWAQKRTQNNEDFFLGGRQLGPVVAAISYSASSSSAWTLLGMSGLAYVMGVASLWLAAGAVLGAAVAWLWLAPRLMAHSRAKGQLTLTDFMVEDAKPKDHIKIRFLATGIILVSFIFYISAQFQGAGNTFSSTFAMGATESIVLGGAIIIIYTLLGGFWAVSITDTIQGFMMLIAAVGLPAMAWQYAGGWEGISAVLADQNMQHFLSLSAGKTSLAGAGFIIGGLAVSVSAIGQPHLVTRFMALRDEKALKQARWLAIAWFGLVFFGMCFLGIATRAILPELANPETLFFAVTQEIFPPLISGIMIAAVLSAIMSTADSMLLVGAACVSHDLGVAKRFVGKELLISRLAMLGLALAAIAMAIHLPASIFNRALFAWVALGSAFGPVLIIRLAGMTVSAKAVFWSMLTSFCSAIILYFLPNTPGDIAERLLPFMIGVAVLLSHKKRAA